MLIYNKLADHSARYISSLFIHCSQTKKVYSRCASIYRLTNRQQEKRGWNRANTKNHARKEKRPGKQPPREKGERRRRTRALYKTGVFTTERFNCPWTLSRSRRPFYVDENAVELLPCAKAQFAYPPRLAQRDEMRNRFIIRHDRVLGFCNHPTCKERQRERANLWNSQGRDRDR